MGTRSLTRVYESWEDEKGKKYRNCILAMYRQFDGYPSGHGQELYEFLKDMKICNGIGIEQKKGKWANGMGCLAAQLVAHFKKDIGQFYLTIENNIQEWVYDIELENEQLKITVYNSEWENNKEVIKGPVFSGTIEQFGEFVKNKMKETRWEVWKTA